MMTLNRIIVPIAYLFLVAGCRTQPETALPTVAFFPTLPSTAVVQATFVATLRPINPIVDQTASVIPSATITETPVSTSTVPPTATLTPLPTMTNTPLPSQFIFGYSAQGRELQAFRYGTGGNTILLVAGIHAGFEQNPIRLLNEMRTHFETHPQDIASNITFLIVPLLNPDGFAKEATLAGRFNGNGVDLNRNWGCDWQAEAYFRDIQVSAGTEAFSEPETKALGALIQQVRPVTVLFFHSAANGVFAGHCNTVSVSDEMSQIYGEASGYLYGDPFTAYPVTGTAPNWVDSLGIPSADIELATSDDVEFIRNMRGVFAIQDWVVRGENP